MWSASPHNQDVTLNTTAGNYNPLPQSIWADRNVAWLEYHQNQSPLQTTVLLTKYKPYHAATRKSDTEALSRWLQQKLKLSSISIL